MPIALSDHFTYKRIFRFVIPSILMMVFTSLYSLVDGYFISNYAGKAAFTAINLVWPFVMVLSSIGFMFGAGGNAAVSITMGEGHPDRARKYFSMIIYTALCCGCILGILALIFVNPICRMLGASDITINDCVSYGIILFIGLPFYMLQCMFQTLMITAERPKLGFYITLAAGLTNMIGDYLLVAVFNMGIRGAALASVLGMVLGSVIPFIYFMKNRTSRLWLVKTAPDFRVLRKVCFNGSSELLSNISMSLVSIIYNRQLLKFAGEDGVAAYGVIMYASFIFVAILIGYSTGISPVIGYNYGAADYDELHSVFNKSIKIVTVTGAVLLVIAIVFARPLSAIFVGYDQELLDFTVSAYAIVNAGIIFTAVNIFSSAFFTALGDGLTSAIISFLRTLVFQLAAVLILPLFLGTTGIWISMTAAEFMAFFISLYFLIKKQPLYHY